MKLPERAVAIVIKDNQVLIMERINNGKHYFTFPGGGVEDGETVEEAVAREVLEETTITVTIEKLLYTHYYNSSFRDRSNQYFYLCSYISGAPVLGESIEKEKMKKGNNFYKPQWVLLGKLSSMLLYPLEIRDWLLEDIRNDFIHTPREAHIKIENLRQTL